MMEDMIKTVFQKMLQEEYPFLVAPSVIYAKVTAAKQLDKTYELQDVTFKDKDTGESVEGTITGHWHQYTLVLLDRFGNPNDQYPPVPGVQCKKKYKTGATVAVVMPYGESNPFILEEVVL